jgi:hypothetical protein
MVSADRVSVVHGVEGRDLVHSHGRHLQYSRNLVHDANARESVLSLAKIKQRHDSRFLVLAWVPDEYLLDELLILRVEFERNVEVVLRSIAMLDVQ